MKNINYYPTYEEMLYPEKINKHLRQKAIKALNNDELNTLNLLNLTWKNQNNTVRKIVLPPKLTGVKANIVVLLGKYFPSGSHKVGPAYTTLIEGFVDGNILPDKNTVLSPSTGNFGIGSAYICTLMGYDSIVVMPENVSIERHQIIKKYGGKLELTPSCDSDVILTLQKTYELVKKNPSYRILAQFEIFSNYRFHRYVTGNSAIQAVKNLGNEKIACYCSAPGSGGTLAAGDEIKKVFPKCKIAAVEPYESSTLSTGRRGQHRIEGIGDKMCTLIHNVLNTDFVVCIKDEQAMLGLKIIHDCTKELKKLGIDKDTVQYMKNLFGPSGICNIIAAIKMAKQLNLSAEDNVVTIATDGFDRYGSVLKKLNTQYKHIDTFTIKEWINNIFLQQTQDYIYDFRDNNSKEKLYLQKEKDWIKFGHSKKYLDSMKNMSFWDNEYSQIKEYDKKIKALRQK
ncbi:pyridoxal-phosphate dependent enzyme [Clostridium aestuarii]|uniref:Pyridoxal-phosphate dependent enzyme n=1 Tax=Clostridium aestuarii TaxID=338193 RepID=A0ABT4CYR1_9CLOT|nr:pyridoxal-phosphate dependent enzyme [Clostridium aestuarii]MCY6483532.1 pyridoxal-phosphate dependent enzyme [Clostridium aestuarii]